jgi:hypothetical protein
MALMPTPEPRYLYRGQVRRYSPCLPSIFRGVAKPARGLEELPRVMALGITTNVLRSAWYCQLLDNHPVIGWASRRQLYLDRMALAQHYGIPTGYMDFTESIEVALFFATHELANGVSKPCDNGTGILYRIDLLAVPETAREEFLRPIGIQPFARPFRQWAWTYELTLGQDFEACPWVEAVEFAQDEAFSRAVATVAEQSGSLFPPDFLADLAMLVNQSNVLPENLAWQTAKDLCGDAFGFVNTSPEQIIKELSAALAGAVPKVELSGLLPEFFSEEILDELASKWASEKHNFEATVSHGMQVRIVRTIAGGTVRADAGNSARAFKTDLTSDVNDLFKDCTIVFTSGALKERGRKVEAYNAVVKIITVSSVFASTPAAGDRFILSATIDQLGQDPRLGHASKPNS